MLRPEAEMVKGMTREEVASARSLDRSTWGYWRLAGDVLEFTKPGWSHYYIPPADFRTAWDYLRWTAHPAEKHREVISQTDLGDLALAIDDLNGIYAAAYLSGMVARSEGLT